MHPQFQQTLPTLFRSLSPQRQYKVPTIEHIKNRISPLNNATTFSASIQSNPFISVDSYKRQSDSLPPRTIPTANSRFMRRWVGVAASFPLHCAYIHTSREPFACLREAFARLDGYAGTWLVSCGACACAVSRRGGNSLLVTIRTRGKEIVYSYVWGFFEILWIEL